MRASDLELYNFRNYEREKISFGDEVNIIYGDNGMGKTKEYYRKLKKEAHDLYVHQGLSNKEISVQLRVSKKSVSKWKIKRNRKEQSKWLLHLIYDALVHVF